MKYINKYNFLQNHFDPRFNLYASLRMMRYHSLNRTSIN